ncbi:hypothetical protein AB4J97_04300 [Serratia fonticola]|uniref:hypothetical protein n=1 Tax=Serratia fonticola TaxID=47917 RepID=UPI0034C62D84
MNRRDIFKNASFTVLAAFGTNALGAVSRTNNNQIGGSDHKNTNSSSLRDRYSDSIIVSSRDELIEAQDYIKNIIKKRTEIFFAKEFKPWVSEKTDIDLAFVTLVGHADGTIIDATGIPDVDGNYFIRFYNSRILDVGNLPNLGGTRMSGLLVRGPGKNSKVVGRLFHSPEGNLGGFSMGAVAISEFGRGDVYQQNSYCISHFGAQISRSGIHIDMPSGFKNYGENISYFGGCIATSAGTGVRNSNGNGEIYLSGVSIDYVGRVLEANAGTIVVQGGHHEFNNRVNPLKLIPYFCGKHQSANIVMRDVTIMGFIKDKLPVDAVIESMKGGGGVYLYCCKLLNLLTQLGQFKVGQGIFNAIDSRFLSGNGNFSVSVKLSQIENQLADGDLSSGLQSDWIILEDISENPKVLAVNNKDIFFKIKLTNDNQRVLQFTKNVGDKRPISLVAIVPARRSQNYTYSLKIKGDDEVFGGIVVSAYFVNVSFFSSEGIPKIKKKNQHGPSRIIDFSSLTYDWNYVAQSPLKFQTPEWATHYMLVINTNDMGTGSFSLSDTLITSM